jgi:hypothetical protein
MLGTLYNPSQLKRLPSRHALKARINSRDHLSEALETCLRALRTQVEAANDLDQDIKVCQHFLPPRLPLKTILPLDVAHSRPHAVPRMFHDQYRLFDLTLSVINSAESIYHALFPYPSTRVPLPRKSHKPSSLSSPTNVGSHPCRGAIRRRTLGRCIRPAYRLCSSLRGG